MDLQAKNVSFHSRQKWKVFCHKILRSLVNFGESWDGEKFMNCNFDHNAFILFEVSVHFSNIRELGSVTFWYGCGSGSSDSYLCPTDPDADPGGAKTYGSGALVKVIRSHKTVEIKVFLTICLMMEGSGSPDPYM
jgi:hypothetical protein